MVSPSVKSVPAEGDPPAARIRERYTSTGLPLSACRSKRAELLPGSKAAGLGGDAGPALGQPAGAAPPKAESAGKIRECDSRQAAPAVAPRASGGGGGRHRRAVPAAQGSARTPPGSRPGEPCGQSPRGSSSGAARGPCPARGHRRRGRLAAARGRAGPGRGPRGAHRPVHAPLPPRPSACGAPARRCGERPGTVGKVHLARRAGGEGPAQGARPRPRCCDGRAAQPQPLPRSQPGGGGAARSSSRGQVGAAPTPSQPHGPPRRSPREGRSGFRSAAAATAPSPAAPATPFSPHQRPYHRRSPLTVAAPSPALSAPHSPPPPAAPAAAAPALSQPSGRRRSLRTLPSAACRPRSASPPAAGPDAEPPPRPARPGPARPQRRPPESSTVGSASDGYLAGLAPTANGPGFTGRQ
ncbi:translation initiation factor IF-2-like [Serinus canaria]|uniref:translation initiation factor IF-2-like n=1 Tax=Serinus canaria TaxID=9135 RepID=UPI0021CCFE9A|nr:translation initiation factor IF-2-like [Serinus canaria]